MTRATCPAGRPIRLGMPLIGHGRWRGGLNYQRTLLQVLAGPLAGEVEPCVLVPSENLMMAQDAFGPELAAAVKVDDRVRGAGTGPRAVSAMLTGCDRGFARVMAEHEIDVVFETARYYGRRFPLPILAWMPDFQHRHLPHLFRNRDWWKRDLGYRAQARGGRVIMLSSETARADCERFYPSARGHTHVVRFSSSIDVADVQAKIAMVRERHGLPSRYFYLPNQFWIHKNHSVVLDAVIHLRDTNRLDDLPPIVMTGGVTDHRAKDHFQNFMSRVGGESLAPWLIHLGEVPGRDVLPLNSGALAVINPSLFEGWATSVEEAKSLGKPLILSAIAVHREQAPHASFFQPDSGVDLAARLVEFSRSTPQGNQSAALLEATNCERQAAFAAAFALAVRAAFVSSTDPYDTCQTMVVSQSR
jgi:glycosyltransferase involved in cell wall biosynthesis